MGEPEFDLRSVPFSRYGSYFAFSILPGIPGRAEGLFLRSVHGDAGDGGALFRVELLREGVPVPSRIRASASLLQLEDGDAVVEICLPEPGCIRFRGTGAGLRLQVDQGPSEYDCAVDHGGGRWHVSSFTHRIESAARSLSGTLRVDSPWLDVRSEYVILDFLPGVDSPVPAPVPVPVPVPIMEGIVIEAVDDRLQGNDPEPAFDECVQKVRDEIRAWQARFGDGARLSPGTRELAAYVLWSSVVAPGGHFGRPAMLMSKNWMCQVWSWDHCFNALALAPGHPDLAWDQLMVLFDQQRPDGRLPDSVSDRLVRWDFAKPPIHGWALRKMMAQPGLVSAERLQEVYEPLCRHTRWWFECRDDDHDGLPQYNHGNDSGWDNGTTFLGGLPVETPDLAAFLVIQLDTLSEAARRLGRVGESTEWGRKRDALLPLLIERFWRKDRFVALRAADHQVVDTDSLLPLVPLVLGRRLPPAVAMALVGRLRERFLTAHGLATEWPKSERYVPDGYWRGPVWAPSTYLIVDGLVDLGEKELAREISLRFVAMAGRSGMAENFDALTGSGLRDRAYTWTASVVLLLMAP